MALSLQRGIAITVEAEVLVKRDATRDVSDIILFSGDCTLGVTLFNHHLFLILLVKSIFYV